MNRSKILGIAAILVFAIFTAIVAAPAQAQAPASPARPAGSGGVVSGKLTDDKGAPLAFANVVLKGTTLGAMSKADGSYEIKNVPAGSYTIMVRFVGFDPVEKPVTVVAGQTAKVDVQLKSKPITVKEVEVVAEKDKIDVQSSTSERRFTSEEAKVRVVNNVQDALGKQAGVVQVGGNLYVRGGRSEEVKYFVDGFPVTDPLRGGASMDVSLSSLEDVNLLSGGFDAEYGNAQSGVVELTTKEGSPRFTGLVKYMTDDYGAPDKMYFNFDNLSMGFGGPTFLKGLTYYVSGEGLATNTYLHTGEVRAKRRLFGVEFRERQRSLFSAQSKLSYKLGGNAKLTGEFLASDENFDNYNHRYSRVGYYSPTSGPGGGGIWWFQPLDSTFTYYNAPEHTPNILNQHRTTHLRYTQTLSGNTFYTLGLGLHKFYNEVDVKDKTPTDYTSTSGLRDDYDPLNLFYAIRGDGTLWRRQWSDQWTFKGDLTHERGNKELTVSHKFKTGFEYNYYDLQYDLRDFPSEDNPLGAFPDRYQIGSWGLSGYVQDRFKYEGMVLNAGIRFDAYDPSKKAYERANHRRDILGLDPLPDGLTDRMIFQVSPRLGMAYPISDRDVLHFHYGRFQEVPRLETLYRYTGEDATINPNTVIGNPYLEATTTISYEVGIEHQFWGMSSINTTFFYRDQFGLIGTKPEEFGGEYDPRNPPGVSYVNLDYGSSQGVEFSLRKNATATGTWSGGITYTYSQARGSSSSELQGAEVATGGQDRAPITEVVLAWDRPHVLSGNLYFQEQGNWGLNLEATYSSGEPFTPLGIYDKTTPVEKINTARLPEVMDFSLKGDKRYKIYGQEFSLFLEGKNLTNRENVFTLGGTGGTRYYTVFYTEFGEFGGAYNLRDVRSDLTADVLLPLNDPSVFDEPRSFRVGIQFDW